MAEPSEDMGAVRRDAKLLLGALSIARLVVVDDQYSSDEISIQALIGFCSRLEPQVAAALPHLGGVPFDADREVWTEQLLGRWGALAPGERLEALTKARQDVEERVDAGQPLLASEPPVPLCECDGTDEVQMQEGRDEPPATAAEPLEPEGGADARAAATLEGLLGGLEGLEFLPLSLAEWTTRADELLRDGQAAATVFLFDRDFSGEGGTDTTGIELVRFVQQRGVGFCGLVTHMAVLGAEVEEWDRLANEYGLSRNTFVVVAKDRLTAAPPDFYAFLRMLRLMVLSGRCAAVKDAAWSVFDRALQTARGAVEGMPVVDFDQVVLASSRREGVWEPDTLFRVFSVLLRREARKLLHQDVREDMQSKVSEARRVSAIPETIARQLGHEPHRQQSLQIQRFELYDDPGTVNGCLLPLELGDIFETQNEHKYVLLAQPCDLMVRPDGERSRDSKAGRCAALVELAQARPPAARGDSWVEIPYFDGMTGASAYVNLACAHRVRLAVLDLCALRVDGVAELDAQGECPRPAIPAWQARFVRLQRLFRSALGLYAKTKEKQLSDDLARKVLPQASATLGIAAEVTSASSIRYSVKRVGRINQPRSGALLTALAQYQSRAAFEHPFDKGAEADPGEQCASIEGVGDET